MTLAELLAQLEAGTITKEQFAVAKKAIMDAIEGAKNTLSPELQKKEGDITALMTALKQLGYAKSDLSGINEFVQGLDTKIKSTDSNKTELQKVMERLEAVQNELTTTKTERETERKKNERATLTQKLSDSLGNKLYASNAIIDSLLNNGAVKMVDGKMVFSTDTGDVSDFDAGIKHILDKNKDSLKTEQRGGGGSNPSQEPTKSPDISHLSAKELANSPEILKQLGVKL